MKKAAILFLFIIFLSALFSLPSSSQELHEWYEGYKLEPYWYKSYNPLVVQYQGEFVLDIVENRIAARGEAPIAGLLTYANRVNMEKRAVQDSINNLIEQSLELRVDTNRRVKNLLKDHPGMKDKIAERIKAIYKTIHYRIFTMKKVLRVTSVAPYKGPNSLLNVIIPFFYATPEATSDTDVPESEEGVFEEMGDYNLREEEGATGVFSSMSPTLEMPSNITIHGTYTGLIIDARGMNIEPAINPMIFDEHGNIIFGDISGFDIEQLYRRGKTAYFTSTGPAYSNYRAGKNPLFIKAIKAQRNCDPIVSFKDAYRIIEENKKTGFLEKLNVSIII